MSVENGVNTCCAWAGGTFFPPVLRQEVVIVLLTNLQYNTRWYIGIGIRMGRDDGLMSPRGYATFNSYIKNLHFLYSG
jgi:hypothetical protein